MYKVEKINQKIYLVLFCITASLFMTACASMKQSTSSGLLVIQEQGSFAVGGTVVTAPGEKRATKDNSPEGRCEEMSGECTSLARSKC